MPSAERNEQAGVALCSVDCHELLGRGWAEGAIDGSNGVNCVDEEGWENGANSPLAKHLGCDNMVPSEDRLSGADFSRVCVASRFLGLVWQAGRVGGVFP